MKLITATAEAKLVEYLTTHKQSLHGGVVLHFRFDQLLEHYRSDYQLKIATNLLTDLFRQHEGAIYFLMDGSIMIVAHDLPTPLLDKAVFQLRYLFMDDPLAYTADGQENLDFCQIYPLEQQYDAIFEIARKRMLLDRGNNQPPPKQTPAKSADPQQKYFSASSVQGLEQAIENTDLLPAIRRQPVCATIPNMSVKRVFDELYLNIAHLRRLLNTDVDLLSNRWLFKYLTLTMDERMLALIQEHSKNYLSGAISLNLNVRTLMSEHFAVFNAALKPSARVSVVIEIQASDVFEDMNAFISARDSVQKLGYRVCLDGLNNKSFSMIDRDVLGVDLVKLQWNANVKSDVYNQENLIVANAVQRCGANRIVLTRCDNRQAVEYGQALGISLFQGRHLDELIDPSMKSTN